MKYNAFISYSHYSDSKLAPALESGLQSFAKKMFQRRALNIFRDSNDLSAAPDLWKRIETGLLESEYFIFLASPRAAQSIWCQKEVDFWNEHKTFDKFLIVLTHGELEWDHKANDFNWKKTTAVPRNLSGRFTGTPLYVDMRDINRDNGVTLKDPEFKTKIVMLAATLHGKSVGDMTGDEVRQHKRTLRIRNGAITVLSVLLIASLVLATFAFQQQKEAEHQTEAALAKGYISASKANAALDPNLALKLAVYGYEYARERNMILTDFSDQLISTFNNSSHFYKTIDSFPSAKTTNLSRSLIHPKTGDSLSTEIDNNLDKEFLLFLNKKNNTPNLILRNEWPIDSLTFLGESNFVSASYAALEGIRSIIHHKVLIDIINKNKVSVFTSGASVTPDNPILSVVSSEGNRAVISAFSETIIFQANMRDEFSKQLLTNQIVTAIAISEDGKLVALGLPNGKIKLYKFYDGDGIFVENEYELNGHGIETIDTIAFSKDATKLITKSKNYVRSWNLLGSSSYSQTDHPSYKYLTNTISVDKFWHLETSDYLPWRCINQMKDTATFNIEKYVDAYPFVEDSSNIDSRLLETKNGAYYATKNGLFNMRNERLINYDIIPDPNAQVLYVVGFSEDDKYAFAENKIYYLDAEEIIRKINSPYFYGYENTFSEEEKEQYLIQEVD